MPLAVPTDRTWQCCCSPQEETRYSDNEHAEEYTIIRTEAAVLRFGHQRHQHHLFLSNAHVDPGFSEAWLQLDCLLVAPHALCNVPQAGMALPPQVPGLRVPRAWLCSSLQHAEWIKLGHSIPGCPASASVKPGWEALVSAAESPVLTIVLHAAHFM